MNIILNNVSAGYDRNNFILHDISTNLSGGGIRGILGPNGSGKTTLLRVIAGILPYKGSIRITFDEKNAGNNTELSEIPKRSLSRYIAMMPQFTSVYFSYTVYDTVLLGRYAHSGNSLRDMLGSTSASDKEAVELAIETTGLNDIRNCSLSSLSGGQLQRVMLARTMAQETPIILLDEPTNHLDLKYHMELISYLKEWVGKTTNVNGITCPNTVISVFHDIGTASILAETILLLKEGRIIKGGSTEEIITRSLLRDIYDADVLSYYEEIEKKLKEMQK